MPDKVFVDTNVLVYFISAEEDKKVKAGEVIFSGQEVHVSSQVMSEFISVCFSKSLLALEDLTVLVDNFFESLLENNCSMLYTEDMQDGQIIDDKLTIVNPFS